MKIRALVIGLISFAMIPVIGFLALIYLTVVAIFGAPDGTGGGEPGGCVVRPAEEELKITVEGDESNVVTLSVRQLEVAAEIINVGRATAVPDDGIIVALMVALQESTLRNLANDTVPESSEFPNDGEGSDEDSVNAFQQRPSMSWGAVEDLMNERYAAAAFYGGSKGPNEGSPRGLLDIEGWRAMPKGEAAQKVQFSRHPERYAKWESGATKIVTVLGEESGSCSSGAAQNGDVVLPIEPGFVVSSGGDFGPRNLGGNASRWHAAVDLSYPGGPATTCDRPVFAAMDGTVTRSDELWMSIQHEDGFVISYLHMYLDDHLVSVGDEVAAGTQIGVIGNAGADKGMSFGCHLDYRIDTTMNTNPDVAKLKTVADIGGDPTWANFINPREFMVLFDVPLMLGDPIHYSVGGDTTSAAAAGERVQVSRRLRRSSGQAEQGNLSVQR